MIRFHVPEGDRRCFTNAAESDSRGLDVGLFGWDLTDPLIRSPEGRGARRARGRLVRGGNA
jgi:hypothetical protein